MNTTNGAQVQSANTDWMSDAQVTCEEMPGFEAYEAKAEYALQVEFAALQVRARAHTKGAWWAYEVAGARSEAVELLVKELEEAPDTLTARVVRVLAESRSAERQVRADAFTVWADLSKLANADGYDQLDDDDTRKGVAALHAMENAKAEELLQLQSARRERTREREAAELADARGDAAHN